MKNLKLLYTIILILTCIAIALFYQLTQTNQQLESKNRLVDDMVFSYFTSLSKEFHSISETLSQYDEDMSAEEQELYFSLLRQHSTKINHTGMNLSKIFASTDREPDMIYDEYIWFTENFIDQIRQGEITDESDIHEVASVFEEESSKMQDLFYQESIGYKVNDQENIDRIVDMLSAINDEMEKVSN